MSPETVTGLADGANNCWSVLSIIKPECSTLECVLDFHIGKRFQNVKTALGDAFANVWTAPNRSFGMVKPRMLWQSWPNLDNVTDEATRSKITGLYDYIHRNQAYIVNYDERKRANKTYTSQVAESHWFTD